MTTLMDETTDHAVKPACTNAPDLWFDPAEAQTAIRFCAECPMRQLCLELALEEEAGQPVKVRHGIRGGLKPAQRFRMDKAASEAEESVEVGQ